MIVFTKKNRKEIKQEEYVYIKVSKKNKTGMNIYTHLYKYLSLIHFCTE
jgi:hypothetical protein